MGKITQRMILGRYGVKTDPPTGKVALNKDPRFSKQHQQYEKQGYSYYDNNQYVDKRGRLYDVVNPEGGTNLIDMWTNQARPTTLKATSKRLEPVPIQTIKPYIAPTDTTWKHLLTKEAITIPRPIKKQDQKENNNSKEWSKIDPVYYTDPFLDRKVNAFGGGLPTYTALVRSPRLLALNNTKQLNINKAISQLSDYRTTSVNRRLTEDEVNKKIKKDIPASDIIKSRFKNDMEFLNLNDFEGAPERIKKIKMADDFLRQTMPRSEGGFGYKENRLASIVNPDSAYSINRRTGERRPSYSYSSPKRQKEVLDSLRNPNIYLKYLGIE
jgi:hypothetical protein